MSAPLNSADWKRIEAALPAYRRTLDKVQSKNLTGPYTPQNRKEDQK
jgi:hypothetical protein